MERTVENGPDTFSSGNNDAMAQGAPGAKPSLPAARRADHDGSVGSRPGADVIEEHVVQSGVAGCEPEPAGVSGASATQARKGDSARRAVSSGPPASSSRREAAVPGRETRAQAAGARARARRQPSGTSAAPRLSELSDDSQKRDQQMTSGAKGSRVTAAKSSGSQAQPSPLQDAAQSSRKLEPTRSSDRIRQLMRMRDMAGTETHARHAGQDMRPSSQSQTEQADVAVPCAAAAASPAASVTAAAAPIGGPSPPAVGTSMSNGVADELPAEERSRSSDLVRQRRTRDSVPTASRPRPAVEDVADTSCSGRKEDNACRDQMQQPDLAPTASRALPAGEDVADTSRSDHKKGPARPDDPVRQPRARGRSAAASRAAGEDVAGTSRSRRKEEPTGPSGRSQLPKVHGPSTTSTVRQAGEEADTLRSRRKEEPTGPSASIQRPRTQDPSPSASTARQTWKDLEDTSRSRRKMDGAALGPAAIASSAGPSAAAGATAAATPRPTAPADAANARPAEAELALPPAVVAFAAAAAAAVGAAAAVPPVRVAAPPKPRDTKNLVQELLQKRPSLPEGLAVDFEDPEAFLGVGGSALVFRGMFQGNPVAVKVLRPDLFKIRSAAATAMGEEAALLAEARQPNVVQLVQHFSQPSPLVVMRLFPGGTLAARMMDSASDLPTTEVAAILQQLAAGLEGLHALRIIHRDLKPENVLLDGAGLLAIADLGLAKKLDADSGILDMAGVCQGTKPYIAPEVLRPAMGFITVKVDIYALGVILWELLTRQRANVGMDTAQGKEAFKKAKERHRRSAVGQALLALVTSCTHSLSSSRPTASELTAALNKKL